jgi:hypothetical protein
MDQEAKAEQFVLLAKGARGRAGTYAVYTNGLSWCCPGGSIELL